MSILDKASIITTPTAYEDGKLLSVKPKQALGEELLTSFTNGTTYPLDTFVSSGNNITSMIKSSGFGGCVSNGVSYNENDKVVVSFTYTKNSGDDLRVLFSSVNTGAGAAVTTSTNISDSGEYKLSFTITSTGVAYLQFGTGNSSHSIDASITNVSIKKDTSADFDFTRGSLATRVNEQGLVEEITAATDLPRIDFTGGGCPSLLLEPQSTNLIIYSEDYSQSEWTKGNATITSNTVTSPDGTVNASTLTDNTANTIHRLRDSVSLSASTDYSLSVFAKKGTLSNIQLALINTANSNTSSRVFDLENGALGEEITSGGTLTDSKITDFGNGWYRCQIVAQLSSTPNTYQVTLATQTSGNSSTGSQVTYDGDGNGNVYLWGAQCEELTYASSYIPTTGSTATRLKDLVSRSGLQDHINSTEGVLYAEISGIGDDSVNRLISLSDGTSNNRIFIQYNTDNNLFQQIRSGGTQVAALTTTIPDITDNIKTAVKYKENDFAFWVDGIEVGTDTSGAAPTGLNKLSFDIASSTALPFHGRLKALIVFNEALSDAELTALTKPKLYEPTFELAFSNIANDFTFTRNSTATFVNHQGLVATSSANTPRIDYTDSLTSPSLLLEPQSTNLITYSEDFSDSSWLKANINVSSNQIVSPQGIINADLIESTSSSSSYVSASYLSLTIGNTYTFSCFAKKGNNRWIRMGHISSGSTGCWFDLENGVVGTVNSQSATIQDYGNGWYRLTNTFVAISSGGASVAFIAPSDADNSTNAGAVGQNDYVWGAQLEELTYATSYIPTSGTTATRVQESCANATPTINSTEGVLYTEISALADDLTFRLISLSDGTNDNIIKLGYRSTTNVIYYEIRSSGSGSAFYTHTVSDITSMNKVAVRFEQNNFSLWINGVKTSNDTSGNTPNNLSNLNFSNFSTSASVFYGKCKNLKIYDKALSDYQLIQLTS